MHNGYCLTYTDTHTHTQNINRRIVHNPTALRGRVPLLTPVTTTLRTE